MSYSGVPERSLSQLPLMRVSDKVEMLGPGFVDNYPENPVATQFINVGGVPFAWGETKGINLLGTFFKDHCITDVLDLCAGSAAAAIGAAWANVNYDGFCVNAVHKSWCDQIMDRCVFAVVAEGGGNHEVDFVNKVANFFRKHIDENVRFFRDTLPGQPEGEKPEDPEKPEDAESESDSQNEDY